MRRYCSECGKVFETHTGVEFCPECWKYKRFSLMDGKPEYSVYKHTFPNGLIYIGKARGNTYTELNNNRWYGGHGYKNRKCMFSEIKRVGWQNIEHELLATHLTKAQADITERFFINVENSRNPAIGYNRI